MVFLLTEKFPARVDQQAVPSAEGSAVVATNTNTSEQQTRKSRPLTKKTFRAQQIPFETQSFPSFYEQLPKILRQSWNQHNCAEVSR